MERGEIDSMQILKRSALNARDIASMRAEWERAQHCEQINDTAPTRQELADKIRKFWEADTIELTPAGNIYIDRQLSGDKWRKTAAGGCIWYTPAQGTTNANNVIRGPWA